MDMKKAMDDALDGVHKIHDMLDKLEDKTARLRFQVEFARTTLEDKDGENRIDPFFFARPAYRPGGPRSSIALVQTGLRGLSRASAETLEQTKDGDKRKKIIEEMNRVEIETRSFLEVMYKFEDAVVSMCHDHEDSVTARSPFAAIVTEYRGSELIKKGLDMAWRWCKSMEELMLKHDRMWDFEQIKAMRESFTEMASAYLIHMAAFEKRVLVTEDPTAVNANTIDSISSALDSHESTSQGPPQFVIGIPPPDMLAAMLLAARHP